MSSGRPADRYTSAVCASCQLYKRRTNCESPAAQAGKVGTNADCPPANYSHGQALLEGLGVGARNGARAAEALHPQSILASNDIRYHPLLVALGTRDGAGLESIVALGAVSRELLVVCVRQKQVLDALVGVCWVLPFHLQADAPASPKIADTEGSRVEVQPNHLQNEANRLACLGLVSYLIVPLRTICCGILP